MLQAVETWAIRGQMDHRVKDIGTRTSLHVVARQEMFTIYARKQWLNGIGGRKAFRHPHQGCGSRDRV